jgi:hypothetical protein
MRGQRTVDDGGHERVHHEKAAARLGPTRVTGSGGTLADPWQEWENLLYYGTIRRYSKGFGIGGGPWAQIGISARDETARHDWRHLQQIKNALVGPDWEAVELYPAEARLVDPSNRFYLFCAPRGVFTFGFDSGRKVAGPCAGGPPQRPLK